MNSESFHLAFRKPRVRSRRARDVAGLFGLDTRDRGNHPHVPVERALDELVPEPGSITLITGPSGAGKSSLLRALRGHIPDSPRVIDLDRLPCPNRPLVDCFCDIALDDALAVLNHVGLGEAWTYLRTPAQLSAGQQWRFRLALTLHQSRSSPTVLVCDEFTSVLDRVTAMIVARALRRSIVAPTSAIVATSHDDLLDALCPDMLIECDFGKVTISRAPRPQL